MPYKKYKKNIRSLLINITLSLASLAAILALSELSLRILKRFESSFPIPTANTDNRSFHIILAGGSIAVGEPYDPKINLAKIVSYIYKKGGYKGNFKITLAAKKGYSLDRLMPIIKSALSKRPDAFILIAGTNEFLGTFGSNGECTEASEWIYRHLRFSALYNFLHYRIERYRITKRPDHRKRRLFDSPIVCKDEWEYILSRYKHHLEGLASFLKANMIPSIFIFPASNLKDFDPNRSIYRGKEKDIQLFKKHISCAKRLMAERRYKEAEMHLNRALAIDGRFSEALYAMGEAEMALGRERLALEYFLKAKNEDGFPWRAIEKEKKIMASVARRYGVFFLDSEKAFISASRGFPIGDDYFYDAHHPRIRGYIIMALRAGEALLPYVGRDVSIPSILPEDVLNYFH
ncbi:MAG: tetratricopeptide repeat protein, partial [Candidatus Dadabacteria bacterium]